MKKIISKYLCAHLIGIKEKIEFIEIYYDNIFTHYEPNLESNELKATPNPTIGGNGLDIYTINSLSLIFPNKITFFPYFPTSYRIKFLIEGHLTFP